MRQAPRYPLLQHITYFCLYFSDSFICNFLLDYFMTFSVSSLSMSLYTLFLCLSIIYFIHFITCLPFFTVIMYSEKWDFFFKFVVFYLLGFMLPANFSDQAGFYFHGFQLNFKLTRQQIVSSYRNCHLLFFVFPEPGICPY